MMLTSTCSVQVVVKRVGLAQRFFLVGSVLSDNRMSMIMRQRHTAIHIRIDLS